MLRATFIALAMVASVPAAAQQEPTNCTPVHFPRGSFSTTITGTADSDSRTPCYSLATGHGQTATMRFTRTNGNMGFSIYGVMDDRDSYTFRTEARTYKFIVFQTLRSAEADPFALLITVR